MTDSPLNANHGNNSHGHGWSCVKAVFEVVGNLFELIEMVFEFLGVIF